MRRLMERNLFADGVVVLFDVENWEDTKSEILNGLSRIRNFHIFTLNVKNVLNFSSQYMPLL